jgi:hypothetical protein
MNLVNNRYYIGVHKTSNPNDRYLGSGKAIKRAIKKYGIACFVKVIIGEYQTSNEAFAAEISMLKDTLHDPLCYNIHEGGVGGFSLINNNRSLYTNPMKTDEYKHKNKVSRKVNDTPERLARIRKVNQQNIRKAIDSNLGRIRPNQSLFKSEYNSQVLWKNKEKMRDALSFRYKLRSPLGEEFTTNRLGDFCEDHGISQVLMNRSAVECRCIVKGKSVGWQCWRI